jgi:CelD/BcsL family acetyltransferase involved in cellulose biosynthesis
MALATERQAGSGGGPLSVAAIAEISSFEAEWDSLCDRLEVTPFMRPGWISAWWDAFGEGELEMLAARRDGRLTGLLPLARNGDGLGSPTNWHTPEFGLLAEDRAVEQSLIEAALERADGRLDVGFVPEEDPVLRRISEAADRDGDRAVITCLSRSPYVQLEGDWEGFERGLTSKRRSDLRRRRRRLEELGSCDFECHDGSERLSQLVAEGIEVEKIGWEGRDGTPIAAEENTRRFYERVAEWAAEAGHLRLFFLRCDGKPVAFAFCLIDSQSLHVLKIGFDPAHARFAPGLLLTRDMLAYAFDQGLRTYEFGGNADDYKMIFTERCRETLRLQIFPPNPSGLFKYLAWKRGRPLAKWALRRPSAG